MTASSRHARAWRALTIAAFSSIAVAALAPGAFAGFGWGGSGAGGGAGSQTPWTGDVDAAGYDLTGAANLSAQTVTTGDGTLAAPAYSFTGETSLGIAREAAGVLTIAKSNNAIAQFSSSLVSIVPPTVVTGLVTMNGGRLQMFASYTADRTVSAGEGYGATLDNAGATGEVIFSLPTAAAGKHVRVRVTAAQSLKVKAATGDNIVMPGLGTTATAGYIQSALVGSTVCLECIDATSWVPVGAPTGVWRNDNTTSAGYAFTPTPWTSRTPTCSWVTNATATGYWMQEGARVSERLKVSMTGSVGTPGTLTWTTQFAASTTVLLPTAANGGTIVGQGEVLDLGTTQTTTYPAILFTSGSVNTVGLQTTTAPAYVSHSTITTSNNDACVAVISYPVTP